MSLGSIQNALRRLTVRAIQPGLARTRELLDRLGRPDHACPAIHVAGTNGKGSVCALVGSALHAAGFRVGRFHSPHLKNERERILVQGAMVSPRDFVAAGQKLIPALRKMQHAGRPATTFEAWTVLAAEVFRETHMDIAVLETGMGGRLDATSAWGPVILSLLTNVELDHTQILGSTKTMICKEKAAIARRGVPLLSAEPNLALRRCISRAALRRSAPVAFAGTNPLDAARVQSWRLIPNGLEVKLDTKSGLPHILRAPWPAPYQVLNVALAALAMQTLSGQGWSVPEAVWTRSFAKTIWCGRMERIGRNPEIILDGAHNPAAVRALLAPWQGSRRKIALVTGMMADKDIPSMCREFSRTVGGVWTVTAPDSRGMPAEALAQKFQASRVPAWPCRSYARALSQAINYAGVAGLVLVTGSLYILEPVRRAFKALNTKRI